MTARKNPPSNQSRSLREWIAIAVSVVAVLVSFISFRDVANANDNTRTAEAAKLLDEAWDLFGGKPGTTVLSTLPVEAGILEQANRKIKEALLKDPQSPRGFRYQATYFRAVGRLDHAKQAIRRSISLATADPEERARDYITYGAILADAAQLVAAVDAFAQAKAIDPTNPIVFYDLAIAYHAQNRDKDSDLAYATAIELTGKARGFAVPAAQNIPPTKRRTPDWYITRQIRDDDPSRHIS